MAFVLLEVSISVYLFGGILILSVTCVNLHAEVIKQFDTMIFPEVKDKSNIVKRTAASVWNWFVGSGSDHPKFTVPHSDDMRSVCMKIHLEPYKNGMLSGEFKGGFDVYRSVQGFTALYECCLTQYCGKETYAVNDWEISRIQKVRVSLYMRIHRQM